MTPTVALRDDALAFAESFIGTIDLGGGALLSGNDDGDAFFAEFDQSARPAASNAQGRRGVHWPATAVRQAAPWSEPFRCRSLLLDEVGLDDSSRDNVVPQICAAGWQILSVWA